MGSGEGKPHWSVNDGVKIIAATPEALMAEIDSAISNLEYARAIVLLESSSSSSAPNEISGAKLTTAVSATSKLKEDLLTECDLSEVSVRIEVSW